uniref:Shaggy-related protein kinase GSK2-like n=1 Tax=Dermatophagoides pteronyssinus TaxID=6956 RepID=A0A6P6XYQ4_DERPT|nr:shaggy-related protein kinase GSK2-like [Dermatophagoides pteronyssinus]
MDYVLSPSFRYKIGRVLGNGSFGTVCEAICEETGEHVAIKKVLQDPRYKNRELSVMMQLHHPNITRLIDYCFTEAPSADNGQPQRYLSLVMEYMPQNMYNIIKESNAQGRACCIDYKYIQLYTYQILRGLGYIHSIGLCHRDLKPHNILADQKTHIVKLYLWSMGCVFGEMILGKPLFAGRTSVEQLVKIIQVMGSPNSVQISEMNKKYANFSFPPFPSKPLSILFESKVDVNPHAIELASALLQFVPSQRIKPYEALALPIFDDLRDEDFRLPDGKRPPPLFTFSEHELAQMSENTRAKLVPLWVTRQKNIN